MSRPVRIAAAVLGVAAGTLLHRQDRRDRAAAADDPNGAELTLDGLDLPTDHPLVVSADGTRLAVTVYGDPGAPTVVLAHGWTCTGRYWTPQIRALAGVARVVVYDQRGHGESALPAGGSLGPDQLAEDLAAVLATTVPAGERAVLVGHSMGAMGIVAWAGKAPEDVARRAHAALLVNTGVGDLVSESLLLRLPSGWHRTRALSGRLLMSSAAPTGRLSPITRRAVRYATLSRSATPAQVEFCARIILGCPRRTRAGWGAALTRLDLQQALSRLDVPTSVIAGTEDRLTPPVLARKLAAGLPKPERFVTLEGVGHMSTVEAAPMVTAEIRRLLEDYALLAGGGSPLQRREGVPSHP
ncbi:MAG: alpha/beta hydrolase [Actinomycetota bacterium]|nr:alpha/beta hydrolase [Actinomycetota bacterium]